MAKKHKRKGRSTRRRRRVGAMSLSPSSPLVKFGPIAVGFLAASAINKAIDNASGGKIDNKILAGGQVGLGALLSFGGKPSLPKLILGGLLLGSGAKRAMSAFGMGYIGSYGQVPVIGTRRLNGYGQVPVIGAPRRMGAYGPNSALGAYKVPAQVKVMSGIGSSDLINSGNAMMQ